MFFGWFNTVFSIVFPLIFFGLMCLFIFTLISNLRTWNKNNHSPRLSVPAAVVAKRTDISHSDAANAGDLSGAHGYRTSTYTSFYVTFPGRKRRPDGIRSGRKRLWSARAGRHRKTEFSGHPLSWV